MSLLRGLLYLFILKIFLIQTVFTEKFVLRDGEVIYEYEDSHILGRGGAGIVYRGKRIEGDKIDLVAIKVAQNETGNYYLKYEKDIYEKIGDHDSIPKIYKLFPERNEKNGAILIIELLGNSLVKLLSKRSNFSIPTVLKIGLQALNGFEHMHSKNIIHNDVHPGNFALDFNNNSKINIFDFNLCEEFEIINGTIVVEDNPRNEHHNPLGSPRNDLNSLALMLIEFIQGLLPSELYWDLKYDDKREITSKEYNVIFREEKSKILEHFLLTARDPKHDLPDYNMFRNILNTELAKYKNESNYDVFDWQDQSEERSKVTNVET